MTLTAGTKLGRYEIRSQLGAGGMGEVYLAHDPKINRGVAIKILPTMVASDSERLRRFEQEVQATGKLNHPNILAVYDVETHDGSPYVVYELLEGETLRERLRGGAIATRKAVDFALQIANGLSAAHAKGIVHRDLKPDNLFVTNDGHLKILDFGLAKLVEPRSNVEDQTDVLTRKVNTDPGALMGTAGYMSPEQVRGRGVDHRTDIFSFGAVFYEMLSGRRAFHGESAIETLNAILKEDPPDLTGTNPNIAPALERVVSHCLEKSPDRRFQSATDVAFALESLSGVTSLPSQQTATTKSLVPSRFWTKERLIWLGVCAFLAIAAAVLAFSRFSQSQPSSHAVQLAFTTPEKTTRATHITVSPDGLRVAFLATNAEGKREIWVRSLDTSVAQTLAGTDEAVSPFWSPDSRSLGYFARGKLYTVDASGGRPQVLCEVRNDRGGAWNRDGVILFAGPEGLYRVSAQGGTPTLATKLHPYEEAHRWPYFLPDGRHFIFLADAGTAENHQIRLGSLDSQETPILFGAITRVAYAAPGYLLYVNQGALLAQPFDSQKLKLTGEPATLAESIAEVGPNHEFDFSVSDNGVLAYQASSRMTELVWFDRSGKKLEVVGEPDNFASIALSPDGRRALASMLDADGRAADVWLVDLSHGSKSRLTFDPYSDAEAVWSPDGTRVVFTSNRDGAFSELHVTSSNASGNDQKLLEADANDIPTSWSRDGKYILFMRWAPQVHAAIWLLTLHGKVEAEPLLQSSAFDQGAGVFSPNGRFIAYTTNESGRFDVYVQSFPLSDKKWSVSSDGGRLPLWRDDGRELFYLTLDGQVMSVDVKTDGIFESGRPKQLFQTQMRQAFMPYAVSADGSRFLIIAPRQANNSTPLVVVLNWTAKLKQKQ